MVTEDAGAHPHAPRSSFHFEAHSTSPRPWRDRSSIIKKKATIVFARLFCFFFWSQKRKNNGARPKSVKLDSQTFLFPFCSKRKTNYGYD